MAIVLKHGVNPAVALTASFGAGQAAKRQDLEREQRSVQTAQRSRDVQRAHASREAEKSRVFSREQQSTSRDIQLEDRAVAREQFLEDTEAADQRQRDMFDYRIDAQQRAEFEQINAQIDMVQQDETLTDDERQEAVAQLQRKQRGLAEPKPHLQDDPSPWPEGRGIGDVWAADGFIWTRDDKGIPVKRGDDKSQMTHRDALGYIKVAEDILISRNAGEVGYVPDPREVRQLARQLMADVQSLLDPDFEEEPFERPEPEPAIQMEDENRPGTRVSRAFRELFGMDPVQDESGQKPAPPAEKSGVVTLPKDNAEASRIYEELPSGTEFIGPDGKRRRKP